MRRLLISTLALLVILATGRALAQQAEVNNLPASHGVTWSFDPVHKVMQATPRAGYVLPGKPDAATLASATTATRTYTGTIDITVTVNLVSTFSKGTTIACNAGVGLDYEVLRITSSTSTLGNGGIMQSSENVQAVISGNTATCTFTIPYSWTVPASSSTTLVVIQGITASVGINSQSSDITTSFVGRGTQVDLAGPASIPADGTTTTLTASTVL
jgi:hypothetical protein